MPQMHLKSTSFSLQAMLCGGLWLMFGFLTRLAARAGGAGGHSSSHSSSSHSSSHGGSSFGGHSYHGSGGYSGSGSAGSVVYNILFVMAVIIVLFILFRKKSSAAAPLANLPEPAAGSNGLARFLAAHPEFSIDAFTGKVRSAFFKIQAAWSAQSMAEIRPFISDGMYQRFATQFRMMGLLHQQNRLDQIQVRRIEVVSASADGAFDVIDVSIEASMHDAFVCELDHSLDSEGDETFVEYWSFIRKRDAGKSGGDLMDSTQCPSCGAALPKEMGELCRCSYCQVMVNSGEFDWVLAEITQQADYGDASRLARLVTPQLAEALARVVPECPDFSIQLAEDKASNAFMQIMTGLATRNPAAVRRFVSDEVLAKVSAQISDRNIIFNRIYLNESVLLQAARVGPRHQLAIGLSASMQRVELLPNQRLLSIDAAEVRADQVLMMERDAGAVPEKGSLYQHQCANCGGAVGDTLDLNCQYCGSPLNSTRNEWIVTGLVTAAEYAGDLPPPVGET